MKITFKYITLKNFRSVSNHSIRVDFNTGNTLISSTDNGSGKSTVTTAGVCFALYGKPYAKGQKKTSLINSKNGRECLVELAFDVGAKQYVVRRGMKPDLFEIYDDGRLIDPDASVRDYQEVLQNIIGIDEKILFNLMLVGRDKFVPFAEMTAAERRHYVEEMLDLNVFSVMNELNKEDVKQGNAKHQVIVSSINRRRAELTAKEELKTSLIKTKDSFIADIEASIASATAKIETHTTDKKRLDESLQSVPDVDSIQLEKLNTAVSGLSGQVEAKKQEISKLQRELKNIDTADKCSLCGGHIDNTHRLAHTETINASIDEGNKWLDSATSTLQQLATKRKSINDELSASQQIVQRNNDIRTGMAVCDSNIDGLNQSVAELRAKLLQPQHFDDDIIATDEAIHTIKHALTILDEEESVVLASLDKMSVMSGMLKDDGVKAVVVSKYMPMLNDLVNQYLVKMNLDVLINIDPEFNITITSPDRRNQTLSDLSSGQMRRVDLAVMMAWRSIGENTSAMSTNLLILDETLENLSAQGVSDFIEFFSASYPDTNLFVVSQRRSEFAEYFDNEIHLTLDAEGFTKVIDE